MLTFFYAFGMGLLISAPIGPVFAASIRHGIVGGFSGALYVQLGSLVGDITYAILGLFFANFLMQFPSAAQALNVIAACVLMWLSFQSLRLAFVSQPSTPTVSTMKGGFFSGAVLSLSNIDNIIFWAGIGGVVQSTASTKIDGGEFVLFLSGFLLSTTMWCFATAFLISYGVRRLNDGFKKAVYICCAALLGMLSIFLFNRVFSPY